MRECNENKCDREMFRIENKIILFGWSIKQKNFLHFEYYEGDILFIYLIEHILTGIYVVHDIHFLDYSMNSLSH
jgi:hypothetical protein